MESYGIEISELPELFSGDSLIKEAAELLSCISRELQERGVTADTRGSDKLCFCLRYVPEARTTDLYFMSAWEVDSYYSSGGIWGYSGVTPDRLQVLEDLAHGVPIPPRVIPRFC